MMTREARIEPPMPFDVSRFLGISFANESFDWLFRQVEHRANQILDSFGPYVGSDPKATEYLLAHAKNYLYFVCLPSVEISGVDLVGADAGSVMNSILLQFRLANHSRFLDNIFDSDFRYRSHLLSMVTFDVFMDSLTDTFGPALRDDFLDVYKEAFEYHQAQLHALPSNDDLLNIYWKRISYFYWLPMQWTRHLPDRAERLLCLENFLNSLLLKNDIDGYDKDISDDIVTYANFDYFRTSSHVDLTEIGRTRLHLLNRVLDTATRIPLPYTEQLAKATLKLGSARRPFWL